MSAAKFTMPIGLSLPATSLALEIMGADSLAVLALALGVDGYAAVPRPSASSFMPLR
jgi:hypothetical protein